MDLHLTPAPHVHERQSTRTLMLHVLIALMPCCAFGVWHFGSAALLLMVVSTFSAVAAEFLFQRLTGRKVLIGDLSAAVTGLILALNLSVDTPWWMAVVGSAFAVVVVKGLFGGLGDNFVNPALAARALLLASWPRFLTTWSVDGVSSATPLANPGAYTRAQLLLGQIPGSIGEVCKVAILLGFAYLLIMKVITWRIPVVMAASTFLFSWIFGADPLNAVLSGGVLFAAVFMATDYVTCPMNALPQALYAALIGLLIAFIRKFAGYPEGVTYAILLMNIASPLLDRLGRRRVYGHEKEAQ